MADIDVERRGSYWIAWVLGLVVIAVAVWVVLAARGRERAVVMETAREEPGAAEIEPGATAPAPEPATPTAAIPIAQINAETSVWMGRSVHGEVQVVDAPTDRGFWIEDGGARLFAVLIHRPGRQPVDVDAGQTISIQRAVVRDPADLPGLPGEPVDPETRRIAERESVVLVVDEANVAILSLPDAR